MSMDYWMIEGVGLDVDRVLPYVSKEKVARFLVEQLVGHEDIGKLRSMIASGDFAGLDIDDYLYGMPFENFADMLTFCDDTDTITYGDDGEGNCFFYYPPSMPWWLTENDPKSSREVHERIVAAVQKLTDMTADEIDALIDDNLHVVGCG